MAGAGGIEPTLKVLETFVLPLYDAPINVFVLPRLHKYAMTGKLILPERRVAGRGGIVASPLLLVFRRSDPSLDSCETPS